MTKATLTPNLNERLRGPEMAGVGLVRIPAPVVIATAEDVRPGSVLIKRDAQLPQSVYFESRQYGQWKVLTGANGFAVETTLSQEGWHFFFMVPEIRVGAVSASYTKALRAALRKAYSAVEVQNFNALEIAEITAKRFLGMHYVRVVAHPRHVKHSPFLRDLDPHYVARNLWEFKGISRRRAQMASTSKAI